MRLKSKDDYFKELLTQCEIYDDDRNGYILNGIKYISLEEKIRQVYVAMFEDTTNSKPIEIGRILVNREIREEFRKICNGISYLADYK